jgi:hypothetical protein
MRGFRFVPLLFIAAAALFSPKPKRAEASPQPQSPNTYAVQDLVVYVSDFELDIMPGGVKRRFSARQASGSATTTSVKAPSERPLSASSAIRRGASSGSSSSKPAAAHPVEDQEEQSPAEFANELVNAVSESLVSALEKAGYRVQRLRAGEPRPVKGLRIRGVFAEPDERNRTRRLLVGSASTSPRMILYVGVNDLARPEQPLYELANPPSNDSRYGPVITVTPYSPASRFELAKEPTDDELKKITTRIAADLTALLKANPSLSPQ